MVHSVDLTCLIRSSRDGHQCGFVGPSAQTSRMSHADLGGKPCRGGGQAGVWDLPAQRKDARRGWM